MKEITKKEWRSFVSRNADDSYSLVVCLTVLCLWEARVKNKKQAGEEIHRLGFGLSGAQAEMAIGLVLKRDANKWLDKEMVEVSKI